MKALKVIPTVVIIIVLMSIGFSLWLAPSYQSLRATALSSERVLLSEQGEVLQTIRKSHQLRRLPWIRLNEFSRPLRETVVLAEDKRFFSHWGIDLQALVRASLAMLRGQKIQGASTITMQLADLSQEKVLTGEARVVKGSVPRKMQQIWKALFIELKMSKQEILESYLNLIHMRGEHQGLHTFSQAYFKAPARNLNYRQAAIAAALIASPNTSKQNIEARACDYLIKIKNGLSKPSLKCDSQFTGHVQQAIQLSKSFSPNSESIAPHLARLLSNRYPHKDKFLSTLNPNLQNKVKEILLQNILPLRDKNVGDAAAIVVDLETREVKAYVAALEEVSRYKQVDGIQASRQAGSTLKPFIYAKAIDQGVYLPSTVLSDDRTAISWDGGVYRPTNYSKNYFGLVSVREALASSLNIPAVKAVVAIGLMETYSLMKSLQFREFKGPDTYGASMALGAVDVQLETLARAYMMLARGGTLEDFVYLKDQPETMTPKRVLSEPAAFVIKHILSDPKARSLGFGISSVLETPFWTAAKTGTSKGYRDNWCVGFSEKYLVAVWAGNFDNSVMKEVSGVSGAGPSWRDIMMYLHKDLPSVPPSPPNGVVERKIKLPWNQNSYKEYYLEAFAPNEGDVKVARREKARIAFPANQSRLVKDPHRPSLFKSLVVRITGSLDKNTRLFLNDKDLGAAKSPFTISDISNGTHTLALKDKAGEVVDQVKFELR